MIHRKRVLKEATFDYDDWEKSSRTGGMGSNRSGYNRNSPPGDDKLSKFLDLFKYGVSNQDALAKLGDRTSKMFRTKKQKERDGSQETEMKLKDCFQASHKDCIQFAERNGKIEDYQKCYDLSTANCIGRFDKKLSKHYLKKAKSLR